MIDLITKIDLSMLCADRVENGKLNYNNFSNVDPLFFKIIDQIEVINLKDDLDYFYKERRIIYLQQVAAVFGVGITSIFLAMNPIKKASKDNIKLPQNGTFLSSAILISGGIVGSVGARVCFWRKPQTKGEVLKYTVIPNQIQHNENNTTVIEWFKGPWGSAWNKLECRIINRRLDRIIEKVVAIQEELKFQRPISDTSNHIPGELWMNIQSQRQSCSSISDSNKVEYQAKLLEVMNSFNLYAASLSNEKIASMRECNV